MEELFSYTNLHNTISAWLFHDFVHADYSLIITFKTKLG